MAIIVKDQDLSLEGKSNVVGPFPVKDGSRVLLIRLERCATLKPLVWSSKETKIKARFFVDSNDGNGFQYICGIGAEGGIHVKRDNSESPETAIRFNLPPGTNRQAQMTVDVSDGSFISIVHVEEF